MLTLFAPTCHVTYTLNMLATVHVHRFAEWPPRSSSVERNDGSYSAVCNKDNGMFTIRLIGKVGIGKTKSESQQVSKKK